MSPSRVHGWKLAVGALALSAPGCFPRSDGRVEPGRVENTDQFAEEEEWIYYPDPDVYYSPRHDRHWVHQGGAWVEPSSAPVLIGPSFSFELRGGTPWLHHAEHQQRCGQPGDVERPRDWRRRPDRHPDPRFHP